MANLHLVVIHIMYRKHTDWFSKSHPCCPFQFKEHTLWSQTWVNPGSGLCRQNHRGQDLLHYNLTLEPQRQQDADPALREVPKQRAVWARVQG